ncbi:MAG: tetratricopeptide repeat protein [Anaeromyxobacter sp.]
MRLPFDSARARALPFDSAAAVPRLRSGRTASPGPFWLSVASPPGSRSRSPGACLLLALACLLLACTSQASRLEKANSLRHAGDPKGALEGYKAILADMGEAPLPDDEAAIRAKALRSAADVSYLELGDYASAVLYYRRLISLRPGTPEAREARAVIGDIYRERLHDPLAAIAQYAEVAATDAPEAPRFQLEMAKAYLDLKNLDQARIEAGILRTRWPSDPLANEAQLLIAQAWSLERRDGEALRAYQELIDRRPPPEILARALEGQGGIHAQAGRFDQALEAYRLALPIHPNPDAVRTNIAAVTERRAKAAPQQVGDRAAAFDNGGGAHVVP